jgi:hypothetical protein
MRMLKNQIFLKQGAAEIAGLVIGIQILVKAWEKIPYFCHNPLHVGFLFLAGVFVMGGSIFHHKLEKRVRNVHALFHIIEGCVFVVTALLFFEKGRFRMPVFLIFIGCLYVVLGVIEFKMKDEKDIKFGRRMLRGMGVVFLAFGSSAIAWNWFDDKDPWVFGVSALFVLIGLFYLIFSGWIVARLRTSGKNG